MFLVLVVVVLVIPSSFVGGCKERRRENDGSWARASGFPSNNLRRQTHPQQAESNGLTPLFCDRPGGPIGQTHLHPLYSGSFFSREDVLDGHFAHNIRVFQR